MGKSSNSGGSNSGSNSGLSTVPVTEIALNFLEVKGLAQAISKVKAAGKAAVLVASQRGPFGRLRKATGNPSAVQVSGIPKAVCSRSVQKKAPEANTRRISVSGPS